LEPRREPVGARLPGVHARHSTLVDATLVPTTVCNRGCNRMQSRLQPHVVKAAAACNVPRLQPYVIEAATVCGGGCNRTQSRLQPYVVEAATVRRRTTSRRAGCSRRARPWHAASRACSTARLVVVVGVVVVVVVVLVLVLLLVLVLVLVLVSTSTS